MKIPAFFFLHAQSAEASPHAVTIKSPGQRQGVEETGSFRSSLSGNFLKMFVTFDNGKMSEHGSLREVTGVCCCSPNE
jgi:hypothetical protein